VIAPAVEPVRADEEKTGGTIHKPMFERLMLCHYAVADITSAANSMPATTAGLIPRIDDAISLTACF